MIARGFCTPAGTMQLIRQAKRGATAAIKGRGIYAASSLANRLGCGRGRSCGSRSGVNAALLPSLSRSSTESFRLGHQAFSNPAGECSALRGRGLDMSCQSERSCSRSSCRERNRRRPRGRRGKPDVPAPWPRPAFPSRAAGRIPAGFAASRVGPPAPAPSFAGRHSYKRSIVPAATPGHYP